MFSMQAGNRMRHMVGFWRGNVTQAMKLCGTASSFIAEGFFYR
jgi:hypothetical protein